MVFGIALIYGSTGSTSLPVIVANIGTAGALGAAGAALLMVGLFFKVAAVPFHMWTPDVYEGAPTSVTGFMWVGAKIAGFAAMIRILVAALPELSEAWVPALAIIAALTMIIGNVVALRQRNMKRMLGYSSIAHAGYILMALAASADSDSGVSAALFYMLAYVFTNLGAFAVIIAVERKEGEGVMLDDYKGLARRSPFGAGYGLLHAFPYRCATHRRLHRQFLDLPVNGGRGLVLADDSGRYHQRHFRQYYYLRVVYYSYMFEGEGEVSSKPALNAVIAIAVVATLWLGILPGDWYRIAQEAVVSSAQLLLGG